MKRISLFGIFLFCFSILLQVPGTANAKNSAKNVDLDIVFIGNSITYGANLDNPKLDAPPVNASEDLQKMKGILSVSFSNQGRSGYTTVDYLPSSPTFAEVVQAARQLHQNADHLLIFSIKLGTNDSAIEGPKGAPVSKEAYRQNMKAIVDELLRLFPDSKIVLQQPIWYSPNTQNGAKYLAEGLTRLQSYFPELQSLVKSYSNTHKNQISLGDQKAFDYFRLNYLTELTPEEGKKGTFYLHPNKKGASRLAEFWANSIYKLVR